MLFAVTRAKLLIGVVSYRGDQVVSEFFGTDIKYFCVIVCCLNMMSYGVHEVGLAEAHLSPDEKGVVRVSGRFSDGKAGGMGKPV